MLISQLVLLCTAAIRSRCHSGGSANGPGCGHDAGERWEVGAAARALLRIGSLMAVLCAIATGVGDLPAGPEFCLRSWRLAIEALVGFLET